jgi:hypothetical protein
VRRFSFSTNEHAFPKKRIEESNKKWFDTLESATLAAMLFDPNLAEGRLHEVRARAALLA